MKTPAEITENFKKVAAVKTSYPWYKMLILAVLAGAYIALGGVVASAVSFEADPSAAAFLKGMVFPVGLILVVICGAELFTGNCLLIGPAIYGDIKWGGMFKNWGIVYVGNMIGGVLVAAGVVFGHVQNSSAIKPCIATATAKASMTFGDALIRGILCNVLVCLAVWAAMAATSAGGKIAALYLPVFAFVASGFEHSVANAYYLSAGLLANEFLATAQTASTTLTVSDALLNCLLPSTIGNIIGGCLVSIAYHVVYRKNQSTEKV